MRRPSDEPSETRIALTDRGDVAVFQDPRSLAMLTELEPIARRDRPVLITGPTGSGKDVAARILHQLGPRREGPYVAVHCGAVAHELFESTFFGHVRGAFTGATRDHMGVLDQADGGTLFLDEIGELPPAHQVKLLRVLDARPYRPVGSDREHRADIRFVAATNRDLAKMVREQTFRHDLYARLRFFEVSVPPLAERPLDVQALARHFARLKSPDDPAFAEQLAEAAARLSAHPRAWPFGVRELEALAEGALCFGVDWAEDKALRSWRPDTDGERALLVSSSVTQRDHDRDILTGLIRSKLDLQKSGRGRPLAAATPENARALASLLLEQERVSYPDLQAALGGIQRQTLSNNLDLLCDGEVLVDDGGHVTLLWPPLHIEFLRAMPGNEWRALSPALIVSARAHDRFCVQLTSQLAVEARYFVATHRPDRTVTRTRVTTKHLARGQRKRFLFDLDSDSDSDGSGSGSGSGSDSGFEQLLVHLRWPTERGVREVTDTDMAWDTPEPHALHRERQAVFDDCGPGWIAEFLIHRTPGA